MTKKPITSHQILTQPDNIYAILFQLTNSDWIQLLDWGKYTATLVTILSITQSTGTALINNSLEEVLE